MTTSTLLFGKANAVRSLRTTRSQLKRLYSAESATAASRDSSHAKQPDGVNQRELFLNVLSANATKRDAKQYLARFKSPKQTSTTPASRVTKADRSRDHDSLARLGVNLGGLYAPARAIAESPKFDRHGLEQQAATAYQPTIHVALVCLRAPETLDDTTLHGVALTLSQLVKLDMRIMVVLDCYNNRTIATGVEGVQTIRKVTAEQGERLNRAIARHSPEGARVIDGAIEFQNDGETVDSNGSRISLSALRGLLLEPLKRSVVAIIPTLAYSSSGQLVRETASNVMAALSHMLSGLPKGEAHNDGPKATIDTSLDRVILLDKLGGIPSKARGDGAHVFVNLEQEYPDIITELKEYERRTTETEQTNGPVDVFDQHLTNIGMLKRCLEHLPSASSALIVTPEEAASSSRMSDTDDTTIGTGTRRQKNTLIHNLLTNKPMVSSSLPASRVSSEAATGHSQSAKIPTATLVKRGMPLTMVPSAKRGDGWQCPLSGKTSLSLEHDPQIDLPRLVHLIEDSFRRKVDVRHYLDRVQDHIAGLIIAGEYEGGAILTWEQPPGTSDPSRLVPYLDKFAVLASSQGSSGVADILFEAMVRTGFPRGVCWRSRKDNPVNKWYFERADGTWQIPGTNWTMFWTGEGIADDPERWNDYVSVCTNVGPSWADTSKKPD